MIKTLIVQNFKCFQKESINFSPFTILAGANGAGKSSIIQSLLLMQRSSEIIQGKENVPFNLELNGHYLLQLGTASSVLSSQATSNQIEMISINNDDKKIAFKFEFDQDKSPLSLYGTAEIDNNYPLNHSFTYLNAERIGPRRGQEIPDKPNLDVGFQGQYNNYVLSQADSRFQKIPNSLISEQHSSRFSHQVEGWLKTVIPSIQFKLQNYNEVNVASIQYQNTTSGMDYYYPPNTGFGISYVLPIITAGLISCSGNDPVMIVENPEAHLHPYGQSQIGKFLALVSLCGTQVIIETHSEHVINGARIQMAKMKKNEALLINFFSEYENGIKVEGITCNEYGQLSSWPPGFFDQEQKDLRELLRLKMI